MSLTAGMTGHIVMGGAGLISGFVAFATWLSLPEKATLLLMFYWLLKDYLDNVKQKLLSIDVKAR